MNFRIFRIVPVLLAVSTTACLPTTAAKHIGFSGSSNGSNELALTSSRTSSQDRMLAAYQELQLATRDQTCAADSDCKLAMYGVRPTCGGSNSSLTYSALRNSSAQIETLVSQYNAANVQFNQAWGLIEDCSLQMTAPPVPSCVAQSCRPTDENPSRSLSDQLTLGCASYNDGCNTCSRNVDGSTTCTQLACFTRNMPYCLAINTDTCLTYFDGCNFFDQSEGAPNEPHKTCLPEELEKPYCARLK